MSDFEKIVEAENRRTLCWVLFGLLMALAYVAMAQPIMPTLAATIDTNAAPEMRSLQVSWRKATNIFVTSYDWGMTNAGTNHGGNTTLTNIST